MIRLIPAIAFACLLSIQATAPAAFAQGSFQHHGWCLSAGSGKVCAYETLAQCKAAKAGSAGRCVRNTPTSNPTHR